MSDYKVKKTDAEWKAQLDPMQYEVARHAATERAFTGKYWDHWDQGKYNCVGCGTPLFDSGTKFDAGCGWPSYFQPINSEVVERVVENITAGVVSLDADRRIVMTNRVAGEMLGVLPGERLPRALAAREDLRPVAEFLERASRLAQRVTVDWGGKSTIDLTATVIK